MVVVCISVAGCTGTPSISTTTATDAETDVDTATASVAGTDSPPTEHSDSDLGGDLQALLAAENRTADAQRRDLTVDGDAVLVVIELDTAETAVPDRYVERVDSRHEDLVQAYVRFDNLRRLANDSAVTRVRRPFTATRIEGGR
jgi:hypothetical protein